MKSIIKRSFAAFPWQLFCNITLAAGTYIITAYGAAGGFATDLYYYNSAAGGFGAEMSAEFNFSTSTTLTSLKDHGTKR